jgi:glyoxylase-like metal-dependent hydrolase (beta-lactamase superfamily II)
MRTLALMLAVPAILAAQNFDTIQVRSQALRGGVYMLTGQGGNIGLSIGDDMAFVIDDQYAPLSAKILAHIATLTGKPVKFVVNTHWHGDHSGGNENMSRAGALIVAHDNVRKRMSVEQFNQANNRRTPPSPKAALPVVTFAEEVTFHVNGDSVVAMHTKTAHTDGDVLIKFIKADVIHMGDTFFTMGSFPYVDLVSGGNATGIVTAADKALAMCGPQTIVIPGHGPTSDCAGLREWRNMAQTIIERVRAEMQKGATLDQLKAAGLTKEYDARFDRGFIRSAPFVEAVYRSLGGR